MAIALNSFVSTTFLYGGESGSSKGFFGSLFEKVTASEDNVDSEKDEINLVHKLQNELHLVQAENMNHRQENFSLLQDNSRLTKNLQELESLNSDLLSRYENASRQSFEEISHIHEEMVKLEEALVEKKNVIQSLEAKIESSDKNQENLLSNFKGVQEKNQTLLSQVYELKSYAAKKEAMLKIQSRHLQEVQLKNENLEQELESYKTENSSIKNLYDDLKKDWEILSEQSKETSSEKENLEKMLVEQKNSLLTKIKKLVRSNKFLVRKLKFLAQDRDALFKAVAEVKTHSESLAKEARVANQSMQVQFQNILASERNSFEQKTVALENQLEEMTKAYSQEKCELEKILDLFKTEREEKSELAATIKDLAEKCQALTDAQTKVSAENSELKTNFENLQSIYCKDLNELFSRSLQEKHRLEDLASSEGIFEHKSLDYYKNICEAMQAHKKASEESIAALRKSLEGMKKRYQCLHVQYKNLEEILAEAREEFKTRLAKKISLSSEIPLKHSSWKRTGPRSSEKRHFMVREMLRKDSKLKKVFARCRRLEEALSEMNEKKELLLEQKDLELVRTKNDCQLAIKHVYEQALLAVDEKNKKITDLELALEQSASEVATLDMEKACLGMTLSKTLKENQSLEMANQETIKVLIIVESELKRKINCLVQELEVAQKCLEEQKHSLLLESMNLANIAVEKDSLARDYVLSRVTHEKELSEWGRKFDNQKARMLKMQDVISFYKQRNCGLSVQLKMQELHYKDIVQRETSEKESLKVKKAELKECLAEKEEIIASQKNKIDLLEQDILNKSQMLRKLTSRYKALEEKVVKMHEAKNVFAHKLLKQCNDEKLSLVREAAWTKELMNRQLFLISDENEMLKKQLAQVEELLKQTNESSDKLTSNLALAEKELFVLRNSLQSLHEESYQIALEKERVRSELSGVAKKLDGLDKDRAIQQERIAKKKKKIARLKALIKDQELGIEQMQKTLSKRKVKTAELENEKKALLAESVLQSKMIEQLQLNFNELNFVNQKQIELLKLASQKYGTMFDEALSSVNLTKEYFEKLGLVDQDKKLCTEELLKNSIKKSLDSLPSPDSLDSVQQLPVALQSVLANEKSFSKVCMHLLPQKNAIHNIVNNPKFLQNAKSSEVADFSMRKMEDLSNLGDLYKLLSLKQIFYPDQLSLKNEKNKSLWEQLKTVGAFCLSDEKILQLKPEELGEENAFTVALAKKLTIKA